MDATDRHSELKEQREAAGAATVELAELTEQRARASARVDDVEREARQAGMAVQQCAAELAEAERSEATARRRSEAEAALGKARQAADQQLRLDR